MPVLSVPSVCYCVNHKSWKTVVWIFNWGQFCWANDQKSWICDWRISTFSCIKARINKSNISTVKTLLLRIGRTQMGLKGSDCIFKVLFFFIYFFFASWSSVLPYLCELLLLLSEIMPFSDKNVQKSMPIQMPQLVEIHLSPVNLYQWCGQQKLWSTITIKPSSVQISNNCFCCRLKWMSGQNDLKGFDLYCLCFIVIIIKLKQRKIQIKLVWNHFDLKFTTTYNVSSGFHSTCACAKLPHSALLPRHSK